MSRSYSDDATRLPAFDASDRPSQHVNPLLRRGQCLYRRTMTAQRNTTHESALQTINLQIDSLSSGAPAAGPGNSALSQVEIDERLSGLARDRATLLEHWDAQASTRPEGATVCDQPQPCPQALGITQKYR